MIGRKDSGAKIERPKVIVSVVERGKGKKLMEIYNKEGVNFHYQTTGHGTATSEIMDILGLDSKDKDIVISISTRSRVEALVERMQDELRGAADTRGVLFDLPLTGMSNYVVTALSIQMGVPQDKFALGVRQDKETSDGTDMKGDGKDMAAMLAEKKYSLILITVNQGYTENVVDLARGLGARGGTVFRARWSGDEIYEKHGVNQQTEKEIVAIVTPKELRNSIMDAVNKQYGIRSKAQAAVCSLNIDHFAPI